MLERVLAAAGLAPLLDDVLSVESVGVVKPDARVYRFAATQLGIEASEIAFQTANAWDAAGAAAAGLTVHWINRDQAQTSTAFAAPSASSHASRRTLRA